VISAATSTYGNELYIKDLTKANSPIVTMVNNFDSSNGVLDSKDGKLYIVTDFKAPNSRIVTVDATKPQQANWADFIAETENVLSPSKGGGYIFASYLKDAVSMVKQYDYKKGNYPLPFSTPANFYGQLSYTLNNWKVFHEPEVYVSGKWYAEQQRIAQGEEITPSSQSFGAGVSSTISLGKVQAKASLTATNIFNAKILNHMSFYRPLGIPELGRSIQFMIQIPF